MMLKHTISDLFEAFDNADCDGILEFQVSYRQILGRLANSNRPAGRMELARSSIESFFYAHPLVTLRFDLMNSFISSVLVDMEKDDQGNQNLKINFAKMMQLPGINPAQELAELRKFFEAARDFMEGVPSVDERRIIMILNNKDRNGKVFGSVVCKQAGDASDLQTSMQTIVESSPVIKEWLRQVALTLGNMGPHSRVDITEYMLFRNGDGPHEAMVNAMVEAKLSERRQSESAGV